MMKTYTIHHRDTCSRKERGLDCGMKDGKCPECKAIAATEPVNELDLCPICGAPFPRDGRSLWK